MAVDAPPRSLGVETDSPREWLVIVVAALLVVAAGLLLGRVTPTHLDEITIENPTENDLTILARSPGEQGATVIGNVDRDETRTLQAVIDQGDTWVLSFRYADVVVSEQTVSRDDLVDGWTIPAEVGDALAEEGFTPSAP
ncbi:hypothetical protein B7486_64965 [cyanobacterium TDX16]|nr:hypothetical protein B7486_64965 [cyanobacterium TDX16]